MFSNTNWITALVAEVLAVAFYVIINLTLPEILTLNKISKHTLSIALLPLVFAGNVTFNPAAIYAIWYAHESANAVGFNAIQSERLVGPFIGSAIGGITCAYFFPDDASSWKRKARKGWKKPWFF